MNENQTVYKIVFCIEKKENYGEDDIIPPMCCTSQPNKYGIIATFDGMGGSGAKIYVDENQNEMTGAKIASFEAANVVKTFFQENFSLLKIYDKQNFFKELENHIKKYFNKLTNKYKPKDISSKVTIKNNFAKLFPTTMALAFYQKIEGEESLYDVNAVWAGDSRVYAINNDGLHLLTKDDVRTNSFEDELDFSQDKPLSNQICADYEFKLNVVNIQLKAPMILMSVTDGCYGYYKTPMDFDLMLVKTGLQSSSFDEWEENLIAELDKTSGDDFSMSAVAINMNFDEFQKISRNRYEWLSNNLEELFQINRNIEFLKLEINKAQDILDQYQKDQKSILSDKWKRYQDIYKEV